MQTISSQIIADGAAVKTDPTLNAGQLILDAASTDKPTVQTNGTEPVTPIETYNNPTAETITVPNVAAVNEPAVSDSTKAVAVGVIGLGALYLLAGNKNVSGIGAKKKKTSLLPLLLVGGAAAYYFYTQSKKTETAPAVTAPPTDTTPATPPAPQYTQLDFHPVPTPTDDVVYSTLFNYYVPWRYAIDRMTIQERRDLYQYVYSYMQRGYHLYNYPGVYPDGNYDPTFYNTILQLSTKWNLQLLF